MTAAAAEEEEDKREMSIHRPTRNCFVGTSICRSLYIRFRHTVECTRQKLRCGKLNSHLMFAKQLLMLHDLYRVCQLQSPAVSCQARRLIIWHFIYVTDCIYMRIYVDGCVSVLLTLWVWLHQPFMTLRMVIYIYIKCVKHQKSWLSLVAISFYSLKWCIYFRSCYF